MTALRMVITVTMITELVIASLLAQTQGTMAIRFTRVWDGARTIDDAVLVIQDGRILSVATSLATVRSGVEVTDMRGVSAIPGLIDLHTHMTYYWDRAPGTIGTGRRAAPRRLPAVTVPSRRTTPGGQLRPASLRRAIWVRRVTWISRCVI